MRPRVSILNLLLVTTIVALAIVVMRVGNELKREKSLRAEMLQRGGILQVADPELVHIVQVTAYGELRTLRWRVYVPDDRTVRLNARVDPVPSGKPVGPRLPSNAIVVAERASANPIELRPGENIVTLECRPDDAMLNLSVVSTGPRRGRVLRPSVDDMQWYHTGYRENLTQLEHTPATAAELSAGRTVTLQNGKTFVLCRFRERKWLARQPDIEPSESIGEVLVWLHPDGG